MKDIAPHITRQRLLIEGFFTGEIAKKEIISFFNGITKELSLSTYAKPIIHATGNEGKSINQGFDAFVPLIDSGISLYIWGNAKFFSIVMFTCKRFSEKKAISFIKRFFKASKLVYQRI